jgi:uncharacterized protein YggU (UPF0235/DUF167 family)
LSPFSDSPDGASLTVRVTPRAGRTAIVDIREGTLLVKLAAAPAEGAANAALIDLLAEVLRVPKRSIRLSAGLRSRTKRLLFTAADAADLNSRLAAALGRR